MLFSDVNIATERRKEPPPDRPRGNAGGRGGRWPRSPSPPYRSHHDHFEMDRPPMRWERDRWHGSPPPMGRGPYHDRERDPHFDRFPPPPHMRDPYGRPRDDPYDYYPRDRDRFVPPRDYYDPPHPRDRYPPYDYPPPRRGSPPTSFDRGGPEWDRRMSIEERERGDRERRAVLPSPKAELNAEGRSVDLEIIVINRQQRWVLRLDERIFVFSTNRLCSFFCVL